MINWWNLITNSIWILALSLALAVVGIAYYQAQREGEKLRQVLKTPKYTLTLNISGVVFCLGMALTSTKWWDVLLWIVFVGLFGYQIFQSIKYKM
jgi:phosphatidylglycerophosphate synthase